MAATFGNIQGFWRYGIFWALTAVGLIWGLFAFNESESGIPWSDFPLSEGEVVGIYVATKPVSLREVLEQSDLNDIFVPFDNSPSAITGNEQVHVWLRLPLANRSNTAREYIFEVDHHWMSLARLFEPNDAGGFTIYQNNASSDPSVRESPYSIPAFALSLEPGESKTFYLKLQDRQWVSPSITLWSSAQEFYRQLQRDDRFIHTYAGLMAGLFVANLCVYIAFRYRDLLYYLFYLLASCFLNAMNFSVYSDYSVGVFLESGGHYGPDINFFLFHGALLLTAALLLLFTNAFLGIERLLPRIGQWLHRIILILFALAPLVMFGPASALGDGLRVPTALMWCGVNVLVFCLGIYAAWKHVMAARYLVPAMVLLVVVSVRFAGVTLSNEPIRDPVLQQWLYASCVEMVILAFGLIDRFLKVDREKKQAQERAVKEMAGHAALQKEFADKLSQTVEDRTKKLNTANKQKERLIAFLAHDIRTPLNALVSVSSLMARTPKDFNTRQLQDYANEIEGNARGVSELMENLLSWAQLQNNETPFAPQEYLVDDLFEMVSRSVATQAQLKSLRLSYTAPRHVYISCDFTGIVAVLRNLVSNAIKFVPEGGEIHVSAIREKDTVCITVMDRGVGLSPDDVARIQSGQSVRSRQGLNGEHGAGLGLQICFDLLAMHQSRLELESSPETGTRFSFTLSGSEFDDFAPVMEEA